MRWIWSVFVLAWGVVAAHAETASWSSITAQARGQTVYWHAWGGSALYNDYIRWAGAEVARRYGVTVKHVKLKDTADAVRRILVEKQAGSSQGSVDMVWINGENFKSMKDNHLLFGPFTARLPNMAFVDPRSNPGVLWDFTIPTDGLEAPWGMAQFLMIFDAARVSAPPDSPEALLAYGRAHPGRLTYPAPPDFIGVTFLKQMLMLLSPEPAQAYLQAPDPETFAARTAVLWDFLDRLHPHAWRQGRDFPKSGAAMLALLEDEAIDVAFSFNIGEAAAAIKDRRLPDSARSAVFRGGSVANVHFLAIPYNASHWQGAMVVVNFLLSPQAQARKQNPAYWGEPTVLAMHRLDEAGRAAFEALPHNPAILTGAALGSTLPEPHPGWVEALEATWLRRYGPK